MSKHSHIDFPKGHRHRDFDDSEFYIMDSDMPAWVIRESIEMSKRPDPDRELIDKQNAEYELASQLDRLNLAKMSAPTLTLSLRLPDGQRINDIQVNAAEPLSYLGNIVRAKCQSSGKYHVRVGCNTIEECDLSLETIGITDRQLLIFFD